VLGTARARGVPCLVLAGQVTVADPSAYSVAEHVGSVSRAMTEPAGSLRSLATHLAETYNG
jgi:glycerate kinase